MKKRFFILSVCMLVIAFAGSSSADYLSTFDMIGSASYRKSGGLSFNPVDIHKETKKEKKALKKKLNQRKTYTGKSVIDYSFTKDLPDLDQPAEWVLRMHFEVSGQYKMKGEKKKKIKSAPYEKEISLGKFSAGEAYAKYEDGISYILQMPDEYWEEGVGGYYHDHDWGTNTGSGTLYLASVTSPGMLQGYLMETMPSIFSAVARKFVNDDFEKPWREGAILKKANLSFKASLKLAAVPYQEEEPPPVNRIPEPATLLLLGSGLVMLAGSTRKLKK